MRSESSGGSTKGGGGQFYFFFADISRGLHWLQQNEPFRPKALGGPSRQPVKHRMKLIIGFGKRGHLEKGSFQKCPFSGDFREFRRFYKFKRSPRVWKTKENPTIFQLEIFRDSLDSPFDSRDSSSEKTLFVITPSGQFRVKKSSAEIMF